MNQESVKLQNELKYLYSDIPNYLACRPGKLTYHVYERLKLAAEQSYTLSYLHPGIFSVQGCGGDDDIMHTVSFGDSNSFPSCDCHDWQRFKLPCVHLCAVFNSYPGWTWDMLSVAYKSSPVLNVDWSFVPENSEDLPGNIVDKSTQTTDATLISNSPQLSRMAKMADSRRLTETPQVLASQCRGLLQQLSKLQLAHHSRDNLYRLKSELKELISMFSTAPKPKAFTPISLTDTYVIQSKGPGRPRKIISSDLQSEVVQSVFEQYNVTPVTPRQVNDAGERKIYPSRNRTSSSQLVISKPPGEPSGSQDQDNIVGTVYIVDPTKVLVSAKDKNSSQNIITHNQLQSITHNQLQSAMKLKSNSAVRKRIQSPSVFLKPPDKRMKDDMMQHDPNFDGDVPLEFTQENVDDGMRSGTMHDDSLHEEGLHDDTLLTVDEDSSISAVIDSQTINIQLEQVSVDMGDTDTIDAGTIGTRSIQTDNLVTGDLVTGDLETDDLETGDLETGDLEAGDLEAGDLEAGDLEAGDLEAGDLEAGDLEAGDLEAGDLEAGDLEAGDLEAGDLEAGDLEAGDLEAGDLEAGDLEAGDLEAGDLEAGDLEAGDLEAGDLETGDLETGDLETGDLETGDLETGDLETGDLETGDLETGDLETGDLETGDLETGDLETGDLETGDLETGVMETGVMETGVMETGVMETGVMETGVMETGVMETGVMETGVMETGVMETGVMETGVMETGVMETGVMETGVMETGVMETGVMETGVMETGVMETGVMETGVMETGVMETGVMETGDMETGTIEPPSSSIDSIVTPSNSIELPAAMVINTLGEVIEESRGESENDSQQISMTVEASQEEEGLT